MAAVSPLFKRSMVSGGLRFCCVGGRGDFHGGAPEWEGGGCKSKLFSRRYQLGMKTTFEPQRSGRTLCSFLWFVEEMICHKVPKFHVKIIMHSKVMMVLVKS